MNNYIQDPNNYIQDSNNYIQDPNNYIQDLNNYIQDPNKFHPHLHFKRDVPGNIIWPWKTCNSLSYEI